MASPPSTTLFLMLGHGMENAIEFEERPVLPPGYTLVTLVEYGTVAKSDEVCKALRMFSEPEYQSILANPRENKAKLEAMVGKPIHVYTEGFKIPSLELRPVANWNVGRFTKLLRSGLYTFPIPPPDREQFYSNNLNFQTQVLDRFPGQNAEIAKCFPYMFYTRGARLTEALLPILYKDSLYPTLEQARLHLQSPFEVIKNELQKSVLDLMLEQGPGVYYFVICRDVAMNMSEIGNFFSFTLDESDIENLPEDLQERYRRELTELKARYNALGDLVEKARTFLEGLDALSDDVLAVAWKLFTGASITREELRETLPDYREFVSKATRIRTTSRRQQGRGRRRSSRRRTTRRR